MRGWRPALLLACLWGRASAAAAETERFALVVGDNEGDPGEVQLRYAEQDAQRLGRILEDLGGVAPERLVLLTDGRADDVRRTLIALNARLRATAGPSLLLVFYSGHGDSEALHLRGSRLQLAELKDLLAGSPATTRLLIVDSCRSGGLTRVKGGAPGPPFEVDLEGALGPEGFAIVTSSAAGEDAQESDQLESSIFTHYLASALLGAADANGDGAVTLGEAFAYASERTLSASAATWAGPQHPTYRLELGGRAELVLTWPGRPERRQGRLRFAHPGSYLVRHGGPAGAVVAEVTASHVAVLSLPIGTYFVTERARDHLLQAELSVAEQDTIDVEPGRMWRIDYARVVRKGGTERALAWSAFLSGGARGELFDLGTAPLVLGGVRLDLRALSFELRLGYATSFAASARLGIRTDELQVGVAGLWAFDLGPVTASVGVEVSTGALVQAFHDSLTSDRVSAVAALGPLLVLQLPLWRGLYLRADGAVPTYFVEQGNAPAAGKLATPVTFRATGGVGWSF